MLIRNSLVHSQEAHSPCVHILLKKKKEQIDILTEYRQLSLYDDGFMY